MQDINIIEEINRAAAIQVPAGTSLDELQEKLASHINQLINSNFEQLVQLLYRIDVSEIKLKKLLKDNPAEDAGAMIAKMVIDRQLQKIKSRREFKQDNRDFDEAEKW